MYELIKSSVETYFFLALFTGVLFFENVYGIIKCTKNLENKAVKAMLRIGVSGTLLLFWGWWFVYTNLYPVCLAFYEYENEFIEEKAGVITMLEYEGKDRICFIIDNVEYRMVYSSVNPVVEIGKDISKGDTVTFKYGTKSKYIFDVQQMPEWQ